MRKFTIFDIALHSVQQFFLESIDKNLIGEMILMSVSAEYD